MSLMRVGGPFHGERTYIVTPALGAVVQCLGAATGRAPIWRKYKPEPGAPTEFDYGVTYYYRGIAAPSEIPATYVLAFQGISDQEAFKLMKEVFW
jgi:hypothetical protein